MKRIRNKLGLPVMFLVEPIGHSGGLAMLWKDVEEVTIENYFRGHINSAVLSQTANIKWKLIGFYGHPNPTRRHKACSLLKYLTDL